MENYSKSEGVPNAHTSEKVIIYFLGCSGHEIRLCINLDIPTAWCSSV